jgi:hypothetical protein
MAKELILPSPYFVLSKNFLLNFLGKFALRLLVMHYTLSPSACFISRRLQANTAIHGMVHQSLTDIQLSHS